MLAAYSCNVGKGIEARLEIGKMAKTMITLDNDYGTNYRDNIPISKFSSVNIFLNKTI